MNADCFVGRKHWNGKLNTNSIFFLFFLFLALLSVKIKMLNKIRKVRARFSFFSLKKIKKKINNCIFIWFHNQLFRFVSQISNYEISSVKRERKWERLTCSQHYYYSLTVCFVLCLFKNETVIGRILTLCMLCFWHIFYYISFFIWKLFKL